MCLAEHYKDAKPTTYASQVAAMLQHDRNALQQHIKRYEKQLDSLLKLLPFATGNYSSAGVEGVRHAGVLLRLYELSRRAQQAQQQEPLQLTGR